jgi:hypothetical protein
MSKKRLTLEVIAERIDGLKDHINEKFEENVESHKKTTQGMSEINSRVKKLELWRAFIVGGMAISGSIIGAIWSILNFIV